MMKLWAWIIAAAIAGSWAFSAHGAARGEMAGAKAMFEAQVAALERELAAMMAQRSNTAGDKLAVLELGIDLRLTRRWLAAQGAAAGGGSELQVAIRLREHLWHEALGVIEKTIRQQGGKMTQAQVDGAARLHELTFGYRELRSVREVDEISHKLAGTLLLLAGPGGVDENSLPVMRPKPVKVERPTNPENDPPQRTVAQMMEEVQRINVSAPLRRHMLALANEASKPDQAAAMRPALELCLDVAKALQANTAVSPESRMQIEAKMVEGLAMFMDVRTRAAGQAKLAELQRYKAIVTRVGKMNLTPEQLSQFGPLLVWAREHGPQGNRIMAALERYVDCRARFEARPRQPSVLPTLRRSIEELEKQFDQSSDAFVTSALSLARPGPTTTPAGVDAHASDLVRALELLEKLDQMPIMLDRLGAYKPKPYGGLETRVIKAAVAASAAGNFHGKAEAVRFILDVHRLGELAGELAKVSAIQIPPAIERRWTGGKLAALDAKWRTMVSELASSAAAGDPLDSKKLARLAGAPVLYDALRRGAAMDRTLGESAPLAYWVDWYMTVDDLKPLLSAYPKGMAEAFTGYLGDTAGTLEKWEKIEQRYGALAGLFTRLNLYRDQCLRLPAGVVGLAAALATPLDGEPFATERYAGYAVAIWNSRSAAGDTAGAEEAILILLRKIGPE